MSTERVQRIQRAPEGSQRCLKSERTVTYTAIIVEDERGSPAVFDIEQLEEEKIAVWNRKAGGIAILRPDKKGGFELERLNLPFGDWYKNEIIHDEFQSLYVHRRRHDNAEATLWYEGKKNGGFSFWKVRVRMPFVKEDLVDNSTTVTICPGLDPGRVLYTAPSIGKTGLIYSVAWRIPAQVGDPRANLPKAEDHLSVKHEFNAGEKLDIVLERLEDCQRLSVARRVRIYPNYKLSKTLREIFFAPRTLIVNIPAPFPLDLVEVGKLPDNEDERAKVLIHHSLVISKIFKQILPLQP